MEADLSRHPKEGPHLKKAQTGEKKDRDNKERSRQQEGKFFSTESIIHALEHAA